MVKRPRSPVAAGASKAPAGRRPRPDIVHSSLYLPEAVYEALRRVRLQGALQTRQHHHAGD